MSLPPDRVSARKKTNRKTTPLGLEQLEARMMNAIAGIDQNLAIMLGPTTLGSTQLVGNTTVNSAPRISSEPRLLSGSDVRGRTAVLTVGGTDDQGEKGLTYVWQVSRMPTGATVTFSDNGTNSAKQSTVSFSNAGSYTFVATIRDSAGLSTTRSLKVTVAQTLTSLAFTTSEGTPISSPLEVTGTSRSVQLRGYDQFGDAIRTLPEVTWTRVSGPTGGTVSARLSSGNATLTFNKAGEYVVQAKSGAITTTASFNVVQTLSRIGVTNSENKALSTSTAVSTVAGTHRWTATALDQFGNAMSTQPSITWSTTSTPEGAEPVSQTSGNSLTVRLDQAGSYVFLAELGALRFNVRANVAAVLTKIVLLNSDGTEIKSDVALSNTGTRQTIRVVGLDQFGSEMSKLPSLTWTTTKTPTNGRASVTFRNGTATIDFSRAGLYAISVKGGNVTNSLQINVIPTLTSLTAINAANAPIGANATVSVNGTSVTLRAQANDQFGLALSQQPSVAWSVVSNPTDGSASIAKTSAAAANITFTRAGSYVLRMESGSISRNVSINVVQVLTRLTLSPGSTSVNSGSSQQYTATGTDQFQQAMTTLPTLAWSATGGTISSSGLFTAGTTAGQFTVTARTSAVSAQASVTVIAATPTPTPPTSNSLTTLINQLNADDSITRLEMIQILRSAGDDGSVSSSELTQLRSLVSTDGGYKMPGYVRNLASDVVNANAANARYKGQAAGNLAAGSSTTLLNNLIDKWFLGADEPILAGAGISYQSANGVLFGGSPTRTDANQGYLGDCYFIAAVTSIADANAEAIRNMFLDNGDGTYTVRFFGTSVDYVTVNRRLPTLSNGSLAYAGLGQQTSSSSSILWVALAEKAYAQWNETGNEGRDGSNTYAGIEGGWMSNVNRQVLGYNSSNYALSSTSKTTLINSLGSGRAVTIGTLASPGNGLVGSHAYTVTGYDSGTDKFILYNPWGNTHPGQLSYEQLQTNCSYFVVTQSSGTSPISNVSVRSSLTNVMVGNWTTVEPASSLMRTSEASPEAVGLSSIQRESPSVVDNSAQSITPIASPQSEWLVLADDETQEVNQEYDRPGADTSLAIEWLTNPTLRV